MCIRDRDSSHVPVEERQNINCDRPDAFEWSLLSRHVAMLREGRSIEQPTYSYLTVSYTHLDVYKRQVLHS